MKIKVDKDSVKVLDRIVEFKLSDDNQSVVATEQCDEWLISKIEESNSEGNQILTDYFNIWVTDKGKKLSDDLKKHIMIVI